MSYLEYAQRGANAWWRYVLGVVLALALAAGLGVVIVLTLQLTHVVSADLPNQVQRADQPGFYPFNGAVFAIVLAAFWLAARLVHKKRFADLVGHWTWGKFATGFAIWVVVLVAAGLVDFAIAPSGFLITASPETARAALLVVPALAAQTFAEEFVFRGYLTQGILALTRRPMVTALVSGLLFGAVHIPNGPAQAVNATIFGIVMAMIAIRTGGIAFTFGLHLANNLFVALVLVSAHDAFRGSPGLVTQDTPGLMWWDAVMGSATLILLAAAIVWWQRRRGLSASSESDVFA